MIGIQFLFHKRLKLLRELPEHLARIQTFHQRDWCLVCLAVNVVQEPVHAARSTTYSLLEI